MPVAVNETGKVIFRLGAVVSTSRPVVGWPLGPRNTCATNGARLATNTEASLGPPPALYPMPPLPPRRAPGAKRRERVLSDYGKKRSKTQKGGRIRRNPSPIYTHG
jgi:hypothetical protein